MHKGHPPYLPPLQAGEHCGRREMGQFTNQQIKRPLEHGRQILRPSQVSAMGDAPSTSLKQKRKCGKVGGIYLSKSGASPGKVRSGEGCDPRDAQGKRLADWKGSQLQSERKRFVEEEACVEHRAQRFD